MNFDYIFKNLQFVFRDNMYQEILRMSLMQSLESGHHEIAQKIHDKFGDHKNKISKNPYFKSSLERYFVTCRQIDNFKVVKTEREKKQQAIKLENKIVYKNSLWHLLKRKEPIAQTLPLNVEKDFECPVCLEYMRRPFKIFSCRNGHFICSDCVSNPKIKLCPICRDDFYKQKPKRCHQAEKEVENYEETKL